MANHTSNPEDGLSNQILGFCRHIAGRSEVKAACLCSNFALGMSIDGTTIEVLLVIRGFQPRLLHYVKTFDSHTITILAVDEWIFEQDVEKGFLGEALAGGLVFPYQALLNPEYLHDSEVRLKKRLIIELLENLSQSFPQLSYELYIKPEYFMLETILNRARLFPPTMHGSLGFLQDLDKSKDAGRVLNGYLEALKELAEKRVILFTHSYVKMSKNFFVSVKSKKVRFANLFKPAQRTLFATLIGAFPRIMNFLLQNRETLSRLQKLEAADSRIVSQLEDPEQYLFTPTASGLVPLTNKMGLGAFAKKMWPASKNISIEEIGGVLNDVYLINAVVEGKENRVVAKRFRDWSSFKWFPLALWTVGTRTFAVTARSRLERECAINQLLDSNGFSVPKILHVSTDERLIFMEYIEGESLDNAMKRIVTSDSKVDVRKNLKIIERVGRKLAKAHCLGVALGDTKPENFLIGKHGEIYFMDFEQAARNGDKVWDLAEFLYYTGHEVPPLAEARKAERIAKTFIKGYLEGGGKAETVRKAGTTKYTKVFSVFTLPHIMLSFSSICRNVDKLRIEHGQT